jgi:hypothetical protein
MTKQVLELVSILLCLKKNIYLVKSSGEEWSSSATIFSLDPTYSMNLPMLSSTAGARDSTVSDFRCRLIIAYRTGWMFSISWAHSFLFRFTVYAFLSVPNYQCPRFLAWAIPIKDSMVFAMGWINGGPNASFSSLRSVRAGLKRPTMLEIRSSFRVDWRGILRWDQKWGSHVICVPPRQCPCLVNWCRSYCSWVECYVYALPRLMYLRRNLLLGAFVPVPVPSCCFRGWYSDRLGVSASGCVVICYFRPIPLVLNSSMQ